MYAKKYFGIRKETSFFKHFGSKPLIMH